MAQTPCELRAFSAQAPAVLPLWDSTRHLLRRNQLQDRLENQPQPKFCFSNSNRFTHSRFSTKKKKLKFGLYGTALGTRCREINFRSLRKFSAARILLFRLSFTRSRFSTKTPEIWCQNQGEKNRRVFSPKCFRMAILFWTFRSASRGANNLNKRLLKY